MRQEKWSEAEAIASNISSLDPLESKFRYSDMLKYVVLLCRVCIVFKNLNV